MPSGDWLIEGIYLLMHLYNVLLLGRTRQELMWKEKCADVMLYKRKKTTYATERK